MTTETKNEGIKVGRYRLTYGNGKFGEAWKSAICESRLEAYDWLKANEAEWTWYELATRQDDDGSWRVVDVERGQ